MKTQKIISTKVASIAIVATLLLAIVACDGKQMNTSLEKEATLSVQKAKTPSTDIHTAAFMGNLEAIQEHINAGSDLNVKDAYGSSPLTIAATFNKLEVAKALIEAGADLNSTNNDGSTPLHTAAFLCRTEIVKALLEKGADKTLKNNYGSTALESVAGPWENVVEIYYQFSKNLGPFGLKLDYDQLKTTRPIIAEMLR